MKPLLQKFLISIYLILTLAACSSTQKVESLPKLEAGRTEPAAPAALSDKILTEAPAVLVGGLKAQRGQLPNGLRFVVLEDRTSPTFAVQLWYRVGARNEVPQYTGLAHLFEHMMFKATTTHKEGEMDRLTELAGVEGKNAFTSTDMTVYISEYPKSQLDFALGMEADRMTNLIVNEESFKTEREVVKNERRWRTENNPDGTLFEALAEISFDKQPSRWPVIGYEADLDRMTGEDALKFYREHYVPQNVTVVLVGDLSFNEAANAVQKHFGHIAGGAPRAPIAVEQDAPITRPRRKTIPLEISSEKLKVAFRIPSAEHPDTPVLNILSTVLGSGKSSRLYRALVDRGIATSVSAYNSVDIDQSLFMIDVQLQSGKRAAQAESIVLNELARLTRDKISELELARARNQSDATYFGGLGSHYNIAIQLGWGETVLGDFRRIGELRALSNQVTSQQINEVAKRTFDRNRRIVVVGVKK